MQPTMDLQIKAMPLKGVNVYFYKLTKDINISLKPPEFDGYNQNTYPSVLFY